MRNLDKYKGVIPAFYACYDEKGEISPERVRALTEYFVDKKVRGVYVNGSSGECIYQSVEDRKVVLENVMKVRENLTVINHIACNNTKDGMELAAHAESLKVDAIAAIPPIYFKLPEYAIAQYWNDYSSAAPNTDFIIYAKMRENKNVIGVKNSSMPTYDIQGFVRDGGDDYIVFNGPDEQFVSGRVIGAGAGIGGTYGAMPELFLAMNESIESGDIKRARDIQYDVNDIIEKLTSGHGNMYAMIKEVLRINEGLDIGSVRKPLVELTDADKEIAKAAAKMIVDAKKKFL